MSNIYKCKEYWRPVVGYEGLYEVSNFGRVRSFHKDTPHIMSLKYEKSSRRKNYIRLSVMLCKDGIVKRYKVHRLVGVAFIPNPLGLPEINHKDENPLNNFVFINPDGSVDQEKSNLEWCDRWYNTHYGNICKKISKSRKRKILQMQGDVIVSVWDSASEATIFLTGKKTGNIWFALKNGWTAYGYKWKYADDKSNTSTAQAVAERRL